MGRTCKDRLESRRKQNKENKWLGRNVSRYSDPAADEEERPRQAPPRRKQAPPPPDIPPGELFKRYSKGLTALRNRITPLGIRAIVATVRTSGSLVDRRPCIVLDYSATSIVARGVRDEIRLVGEHLYLGVVWLFGRRVAWFTLRESTSGERVSRR